MSYKQLLKGLTSNLHDKGQYYPIPIQLVFTVAHFKQYNITTKTKLILEYNYSILANMGTFFSFFKSNLLDMRWHEILLNLKLTWNNTVRTTYRNMFQLNVIYT